MPAPAAEPIVRPAPLLAAFAVVTSVTLALEVLATRLLSVLTWYSLAFLVIGMALFGLTAGAVQVYLRPERYAPACLGRALAADALALSIAIPIGYAGLLLVPLRVEPVATTAVLFLAFAAILALPFVAAGAVVAAVLTRAKLPIGRLYAVDLVGAAIGAPAIPLVLSVVDAGTAFLLLAVLAALASAGFAVAAGERPAVRRALSVAVLLGIVCAGNARNLRGLVPLWVKGHAEDRSHLAFETWNSHSRIQVSDEIVAPPMMWGAGTKCSLPQVKQRWITIDGDAGTPLYAADPNVGALGFLACDVTSIGHHLRSAGAAAIIGVGGSRDVQTARLFGHAPVVGIELNQALLDVLRSPLGAPARIADDPEVKLVHADGRGWLARTPMRFRLIQASLIDTWAATGAGAHALGENGLYTVEAWRTFLSRLDEGGVLSVSRWFQGGQRDETARLVSLATAALLDRGAAHPRDHVALVASGPVATLLVSNLPFTPADLETLVEASTRAGFGVLLAPGLPDLVPVADLLDAPNRAALDAAALSPTIDLRPPTDERPFFFHLLRMRASLSGDVPADAGGNIEGNRRASGALVLSFLASLVLVVAAIFVPLTERARPRGRVGAPLVGAIAYFAGIGVAFMLAEIALLQRLSLVLGHPSLSLVVVLASLVAAAGAGSWLSDRMPLDRGAVPYAVPLVIAAVLLATSRVLPWAATWLEGAPMATRIAYSAAQTATVGLALGLAFPTGMRVFGAELNDELPWLFGVNGVGGVLASSAGIVIAIQYGLGALLATSAMLYAVLPLALHAGLRAARARREASGGDAA